MKTYAEAETRDKISKNKSTNDLINKISICHSANFFALFVVSLEKLADYVSKQCGGFQKDCGSKDNVKRRMKVPKRERKEI